MANRMPMMASTASNSIRVKPRVREEAGKGMRMPDLDYPKGGNIAQYKLFVRVFNDSRWI
jgi:hypothetical protein